jgi:hypothetical protein
MQRLLGLDFTASINSPLHYVLVKALKMARPLKNAAAKGFEGVQ